MHLAALHFSTPLAPLGSTFPPAPPWSSVSLALPQSSGILVPLWTLVAMALPWAPDPSVLLGVIDSPAPPALHLHQLHHNLTSPWVYLLSLNHGSYLLRFCCGPSSRLCSGFLCGSSYSRFHPDSSHQHHCPGFLT